MNESKIESLKDLNLLRTAPKLSKLLKEKLFKELKSYLYISDWHTVGIMAEDKKWILCKYLLRL